MEVKSKIIDAEGFDRIITRIAHEILEKNKGSHNLVLMGMRTRGEYPFSVRHYHQNRARNRNER